VSTRSRKDYRSRHFFGISLRVGLSQSQPCRDYPHLLHCPDQPMSRLPANPLGDCERVNRCITSDSACSNRSALAPRGSSAFPGSRRTPDRSRSVAYASGWSCHIHSHRYRYDTFVLDTFAASERGAHRYTLDIVECGPCRRSLLRHGRMPSIQDQVQFLGYVSDAKSLLSDS